MIIENDNLKIDNPIRIQLYVKYYSVSLSLVCHTPLQIPQKSEGYV